MPHRDLRTSDPVRIRALSHPLRLELLDVLTDGPATATECAKATGESVASCSFHLRTLAKYGYIEPDERRGREKPWKLTYTSRDIRPSEEHESRLAVGEVARLQVDRSSDGIHRWLDGMTDEPLEWVNASTIFDASFWATAEELAELSQVIQSLTAPYQGRNDDPERRPEGSRPMTLFAAAHVDVGREQRDRRRT